MQRSKPGDASLSLFDIVGANVQQSSLLKFCETLVQETPSCCYARVGIVCELLSRLEAHFRRIENFERFRILESFHKEWFHGIQSGTVLFDKIRLW